jgi:hypothetical protein
MDAAYKIVIVISGLSLLAIAFMLYNLLRWKDELHGLFKIKVKPKEKDA